MCVCIACYHGVYTDLSSCQNPHFLFCEQAGGRGEYWQLCVCTFGWLFSLRTSRSFRAWERRQLDSPSLLGISIKVCWSFRVRVAIRKLIDWLFKFITGLVRGSGMHCASQGPHSDRNIQIYVCVCVLRRMQQVELWFQCWMSHVSLHLFEWTH